MLVAWPLILVAHIVQSQLGRPIHTCKHSPVLYVLCLHRYRRLIFPSTSSVIKSRLQANHEHAKQYRSAWHGIRTVLREEGIEGLYKGAPSKLLQSVLTAAILFAGQRRIYEITKKVRPHSDTSRLRVEHDVRYRVTLTRG